MHFVRINDVLLHYRLAGPEDAPKLVFANSLGTDARIWDAVIARLASSYRILSYDKRGHGLSDCPAGEYSLDDHLDDLEGLVRHVGFDRFALCGVSVGGLIAQGYALRSPQSIAALVLCDTAPKVGDAQLWNSRRAAVLEQGLGAIADGIMERWFSPGFRKERPEELAGWRNLFLRTDPEGYAATCATLRDADLTADIGAIALPTLVMVGDADGATPVELVRACADAIPGARFQIVPGAGHIPSVEQPALVASYLRDLFGECGYE
ncbi:MAG: 3-oxoadipate enol-lactonase [Devosia sp.]|uniref:3-oxoadipate enol-lactonase n=1 Tax=Devosia sp. TaxID=1871048 RepID=UPI0024C6C00A|nr:3-oxoadipate enol-lactonase [Devosia sp.]UYO01236.1 MAG: 3-oxoadipate enol-lactonase [Devosia sp.]